MSRESWLSEIKNTIGELYDKEPNAKNAALLSDLLTIINDNKTIDALPESNINENISEMNSSTVDFWKSINVFENSRTQQNKKSMIDSLEKLLAIYEKVIVELRHKVQFPECIDILKQFYINISNRI